MVVEPSILKSYTYNYMCCKFGIVTKIVLFTLSIIVDHNMKCINKRLTQGVIFTIVVKMKLLF